MLKINKAIKKKEVIWEIIVFGWILQGLPENWSELRKAGEARLLLKRMKKEWLTDRELITRLVYTEGGEI